MGFTDLVVNAVSDFGYGNQLNLTPFLISMEIYSFTLVEKSIISHTMTTFFIDVHI